jgi:membrane-associated phospholipid phosphatase
MAGWSGGRECAAAGVSLRPRAVKSALKPLVGRYAGGALSFPSGHATSTFALAGTCVVLLLDPRGRRLPGALRLVLASLALLAAAAVAIGMVLACALTLDWFGPDRGALSRGAAGRPARRSS